MFACASCAARRPGSGHATSAARTSIEHAAKVRSQRRVDPSSRLPEDQAWANLKKPTPEEHRARFTQAERVGGEVGVEQPFPGSVRNCVIPAQAGISWGFGCRSGTGPRTNASSE